MNTIDREKENKVSYNVTNFRNVRKIIDRKNKKLKMKVSYVKIEIFSPKALSCRRLNHEW